MYRPERKEVQCKALSIVRIKGRDILVKQPACGINKAGQHAYRATKLKLLAKMRAKKLRIASLFPHQTSSSFQDLTRKVDRAGHAHASQ